MTRHPVPPRAARGFSLVELLIAVAIGLALLAGLSAMFVKNTRAQAEIEKAHRQVENGRYAIDLLAGDLRNAGYLGEFNPTVLPAPAALPPACAGTLDELRAGLALAVQGVDGNAAGLSCLSDVRAGTDVLVVRRTSTCVAGSSGCEGTASGGPFFQASLCNNASELNSPNVTDFYSLALGTGGLTRHGRDCTAVANSGTPAAIRRYRTHIYFVANNNVDGDRIPTLKRAELVSDGTTIDWNIVPLAEGIDNLQFEYGLDLAPATFGDGVADLTTANPATAAGCAAAACAVANWRSAVAVKVHVLARNAAPTTGHVDRKTYVLGLNADGGSNEIGAARDAYKRHVFQSLVALPNPAGRRMP
ncbi:PilW family protein [Massilia sp. GCM10023247]|uniref:PilW family protein n=1 Tax=Massilia sp. GCM10023247 TaxID=3252643 RepID=UPI00361DCCAA